MRPSALLLATLAATAVALAGEPAELPGKLEVSRSRLELDLQLATTWTSSDHKLRSIDDTARFEATFDVTPREGSVVEASPRALAVTRRKRGLVKGFFSDEEPDA